MAEVPTILQVIPRLQSGGAERSAIDVSIAVKNAGWKAMIASAGGQLISELAEAGIDHIELPLGSKNPFSILVNAARLVRLIRRQKVDLVHARSRAPAWSALIACKMTGVPMVTTYHGAYGEKNRFKALYNSVMARGAVTIGNSEWTAELVRKRYPSKAGRVVAIPRGIDFERFDPASIQPAKRSATRKGWNIPEEQFTVLHLARITRLKGQHVLIEAAAMLRDRFPNTCFILGGGADGHEAYRQELIHAIDRNGLGDRMRLVGHCADPQIAIAASDLVLSTSLEPETFGRVAIEAAALEKPVIGANIGAVKETILCPPVVPDERKTGWTLEPGNAHTLAETIAEVIELETAEREAIGKRARKHALANFSLGLMCERTLDVYRQVLHLV